MPRILALPPILLLLSGCATILNTSYDHLQLKGDTKATLYVNGEDFGRVPKKVQISTKNQLIDLKFEAEGVQDFNKDH